MQPDSVTQTLGLYLVQLGLPAPLAALTACLALVVVPLLVGVAVVALLEHRAARRTWLDRPRGATRL